MSSEIAIRAYGLGKCYAIFNRPEDRLKQMLSFGRRKYYREFWALKDVSFDVKKGEAVGVIGRNGSGKSTLLQIICGTLSPTAGIVETNGRVAALLELGAGFNREFTGLENVYMNGAVLGLSHDEIDARLDQIVAFADIGDFFKQPIKTYSSGMVVRLAFAVAINVNPQILVVDEALAVGDAAFQRKCFRQIEELTASGVTLFFVSHDTETVKKLCGDAIYLGAGVVRALGRAKDICTEYERDLFGASRRDSPNAARERKPSKKTMFLDSALLNSDEKTYGDGRAAIEDISITTPKDELINVIPVESTFAVSYKVRFANGVNQPVFGMMIRNKEGVCVFGTNTMGLPASSKSYQSGDAVQVSFTLTNTLGPGIYYLTCGVHAEDHPEGLIYLQRRMDALLLRSLGRDSETVSGMSHLLPRIQVNRI
ncbi:MAG: ABC transporter ATP-binding protein [Planctomycetota bacterium]|jgi:lipopolysaccharide transport system ATP-binding protein